MASIPHWGHEAAEWDRLTIGGYVMPGVWDVETACKRNIDKKKAKGVDGARITDQGYELPELELVGRLTSRVQWELLQTMIAGLHPRQKGGKREKYVIDHPKTRLLGINAIYITEVRSPRLERGIMTIVLRAIEYVPPGQQKAVKKNDAPPVNPRDTEQQLLMSVPEGPDAQSNYHGE